MGLWVEDNPAPARRLGSLTFKSPFQPKFFYPRHPAWNKWHSVRTPVPWCVLAPHQGSWVAREVSVTATPCASDHCRELEPTLSLDVLPQIHRSSWIPFFLLLMEGGIPSFSFGRCHTLLREVSSDQVLYNMCFIRKIPSQLCSQGLQNPLARSVPMTGIAVPCVSHSLSPAEPP